MSEELTQSTWSLKELGPWIVSFIALAQVWIIALWKKYRKGKVEIYESGNIEIGYSTYGPTIGLTGTLRAVEKDVFVKRVSSVITRKKDGAQHHFNWNLFRSSQFSFGAKEEQKYEIASSFLLTPAHPYKYNIFLTENAFITENRPKAQLLIKKWHEFLDKKLYEINPDTTYRISTILQDPALSNALHDEFAKTGDYLDAYTLLDRAFYWSEGEYDLNLIVECTNPDREFTSSWSFTLAKKDTDNLRLNTISILRIVTGFDEIFNFAYPEYNK